MNQIASLINEHSRETNANYFIKICKFLEYFMKPNRNRDKEREIEQFSYCIILFQNKICGSFSLRLYIPNSSRKMKNEES